jgi:hypothetical protein
MSKTGRNNAKVEIKAIIEFQVIGQVFKDKD